MAPFRRDPTVPPATRQAPRWRSGGHAGPSGAGRGRLARGRSAPRPAPLPGSDRGRHLDFRRFPGPRRFPGTRRFPGPRRQIGADGDPARGYAPRREPGASLHAGTAPTLDMAPAGLHASGPRPEREAASRCLGGGRVPTVNMAAAAASARGGRCRGGSRERPSWADRARARPPRRPRLAGWLAGRRSEVCGASSPRPGAMRRRPWRGRGPGGRARG